MHRLRVWDEASSSRVDAWVANSRSVAERVRRWYGVEDVAVVHPPVAVERFDPTQEREGYYLVAGRLVGYKRVDLAVRACAETGRELMVAGDGPERKRLEAVAAGAGARVGGSGKGSIRFIGAVDDGELAGLMGRCKGLIFAGEEDFGIVPVEAQAAGAPVIGLGRGGLTETVVDGSSGVLFADQSVGSVTDALGRFEHGGVAWDAARIAEHAAGFSGERFEREMRAVIDAAWSAKRARIAGPGAGPTEHGQRA
ncbi:MAG: glycosyltransferase [Planctomycetota bacterium]